MLNMDASDRIKQRMQALGLKAVQVVKLTGASKGSVSQWVNGATKPSGEHLLSLSRALQCSPDWLLTGKEKKPAPGGDLIEWMGRVESWDGDTELRDDEVELPFFTEVELSAGHGTAQVLENHGPKLRFAKSTLKRKCVDPSQAACVKVNGNSMEPVLPDGSTVGIDTSQTAITDGKMYAVDHDGMLRIKCVYRLPGSGIRLKSFNSHEYPDEVYKAEEAQQIRIIGKVFWYSVLL